LRNGGGRRGAQAAGQRRQLRPLQDLRHQGPLRDHHLGDAGGRLGAELPEPVGPELVGAALGRDRAQGALPQVSRRERRSYRGLPDSRVQAVIAWPISPSAMPKACETCAGSVPWAGMDSRKVRSATTSRPMLRTSLAWTSISAAGTAAPPYSPS